MTWCSESLDPLLSVFPKCVRVQSPGVEQGLLVSEAGSSGSLFISAIAPRLCLSKSLSITLHCADLITDGGKRKGFVLISPFRRVSVHYDGDGTAQGSVAA